MSKNQQIVDTVLRKLEDKGIDVSKLNAQQLRIELTKTLELSWTPKLALDVAMPYPIPQNKHHIDYFISDQLIEVIRDFLQFLLAKHGSNATLFLKMAQETPNTIMNNKEIIMQLERLATGGNVPLANIFIHLHSWYNPSENYKFIFIYGVSQQLEQCILHYNRLSSQYKAEARFHKEEVVEIHEENAEIDYWNLRSLLHGLENKVNMLSELVLKMTVEVPYSPPLRLFQTTSPPSEKKTEKKTKDESV